MADRKPRPHRFSRYSMGKWYTPQRYVIGWEVDGVVKVGSTSNGRARYGKFLCRGGVMLDLRTYPVLGDLDSEVHLQALLSQEWPRAFECKEDAESILGPGGGGYLECYRIPATEWWRVLELAEEITPVRTESIRTPSGILYASDGSSSKSPNIGGVPNSLVQS